MRYTNPLTHSLTHNTVIDKSVLSLVNSAVNMTLPASAAERRAAAGRPAGAVDRYLLSARRLAANPPHAAAAVE